MSDRSNLYLIREIQNYGGFFGGEIVTLSAVSRANASDERSFTIDERALANVQDRHSIAAGMLLALVLSGERVESAVLLGAPSHAALRAALGQPAITEPLDRPLVLSYRCDSCGLWLAGTPEEGKCRVCGNAVVSTL
jgi:rubrerythrin